MQIQQWEDRFLSHFSYAVLSDCEKKIVLIDPARNPQPYLEELSEEYKDQIVIYKVDTEVEMELASVFGIRSIPTFLFIPVDGDPMMQPGAFPKKVFQQIIEEKLLVTEEK